MIAAAALSAVWLVVLVRLPSARERAYATAGSVFFVASSLAIALELSPGPLSSAIIEETARWAAVSIAMLAAGRARVLAAICVGVSIGVAESALASLVAPHGMTDAARLLVAFGLHAPLAVWFSGEPRRTWVWIPAAVAAHALWNSFVLERDALALSGCAAAIVALAVVASRRAPRGDAPRPREDDRARVASTVRRAG